MSAVSDRGHAGAMPETLRTRVLPALALAVAATTGAALAAGPATAAPPRPAPPTSTVTTTAVRSLLAPLIASGAPGAAALVDSGSGPVRAAAGLADDAPPVPAWPGMQSRVGSITKSFVATLALQLVGEGKLQLDAPLGPLAPAVPNGDEITLRMLLNHTSGVFNYTEDEPFVLALFTDTSRVWTPAELIAVAARHEPLFPPGTDWHYSNTNYVIVGTILERVTKTPLQKLIKDRIATPLGLRNTYLATSAAFTGPHLHGIIPAGVLGPDPVDTTAWTPSWAWAAGALVSTTADLQTFYRALMRGRLLHGRQLQAMTTVVPLGDGAGYGLGLLTLDTGCAVQWGHDGGMPGYTTVASVSRNGRQASMLLTNDDSSVSPGPQDAVGLAYAGLTCLAAGTPLPPSPTASGDVRAQAKQAPSLAQRLNLLPAPFAAS